MPIAKRFNDFFYFRYHRLRDSWPVWLYLLNGRSRREWRAYRRQLSELEKRIVESLSKEGIAIAHLEDFFPQDYLARLQHFAASQPKISGASSMMPGSEKTLRQAQGKQDKHRRKDFWYYLYPRAGDKPSVGPANPFSDLIIDPRIINIASAYLGMTAKFSTCHLTETILIPPGSPARMSQRWHRDSEDKKLVKVFVYLTDVLEEGAGPFTYVRGSQHDGRYGKVFPRIPPVGRYPEPGAVEKIVPPENIVPRFGRAGTLIFCDTGGFHRGGYSTTKSRIMFTSAYTSRASIYPPNFKLDLSPHEFEKLDPLVKSSLSW